MSARHGLQNDGQYTLVPLRTVSTALEPAEIAPAEPTARDILASFLDWHKDTFGLQFPQRQCGRLGREIKRCLDADYEVKAIKMGMCAWCSYLVEDPTKSPPALDTIVYSLLMRHRNSEFSNRALAVSGLPKRAAGKQSSGDIAAANREMLRQARHARARQAT